MPTGNFRNLTDHMARGNVNFGTHTFAAMLVTSDLSEANLDAWVNRSNVTNEVAAGGGYTTGGVAVTATIGALDTTNNRLPITFSNPNWPTSSITARGAIVYRTVGSAATDLLVTYVDFGANVTSTAAAFTVTFSAPLFVNA